MVPLLLTLAATQYQESTQLKTLLPNGSIVFCENRESPYVSVQLILSNRDFSDQPTNYGYRHLLEHIAARSIEGHDREVETCGGFIFATTSRDWLRFEWRVPSDKIALAYKGIGRLLKDCGATEEAIKRESIAIAQEGNLATSQDIASKKAWGSVYSVDGLDPLGSKESVSAAKPSDLVDMWRQLTKSSNVVISACGSLDQKSFTTACRDLLSGLTSSKPGPIKGRSIDGSFGETSVIAVPIPSITTKQGVSSLVAVFGLAGRLNRPFVSYTPSLRSGLALVGSADPYDSIRQVVDVEDPATMFYLGRLNAMEWLKSRLATPEGSAEFNGTLLSLSPMIRPIKIAEDIEQASYSEFLRTWALIKGVAK